MTTIAVCATRMEMAADRCGDVGYAAKRNGYTGMGVDVMSPEAPPDPDSLKARIAELEAELAQATSAESAASLPA